MSERPILGVEKPELQPLQGIHPAVQAVAKAADDLPLASELPDWDLLPSDALLVRKRPAKV